MCIRWAARSSPLVSTVTVATLPCTWIVACPIALTRFVGTARSAEAKPGCLGGGDVAPDVTAMTTTTAAATATTAASAAHHNLCPRRPAGPSSSSCTVGAFATAAGAVIRLDGCVAARAGTSAGSGSSSARCGRASPWPRPSRTLVTRPGQRAGCVASEVASRDVAVFWLLCHRLFDDAAEVGIISASSSGSAGGGSWTCANSVAIDFHVRTERCR